MDRPKVDYNSLAPTYHQRYRDSAMDGFARTLVNLVERRSARTVLEVGCGTGRWIESLRTTGAWVFGVDASTGMLQQASRRLSPDGLLAANANRLPFADQSFDLICCVNAIHHFDNPKEFVLQTNRLLKPSGLLAIAGIDPRVNQHRYFYEYFDGAFDLDIRRYPSHGEIVDAMARVGFKEIELRVVDKWRRDFQGEEIFNDPFLEKRSNSLLALLTDEEYSRGIARIREAISNNPSTTFTSELSFAMITGETPEA